jgi:predicted aldo/keto reductase-like oxidoreductase
MLPQNSIKRRQFIKSTFTGIGGVFFLNSAERKMMESFSEEKTERKIIYRTLGKTGLKLPVISMGVMNADNPNLVRAALDAGIVHLDTAWAYQMGKNEEMIREVIKGRPRDSFVISTKVPGMPRDRETGLFTNETSGEAFQEKLESSLKRLGLEYVDILYLHSVSRREAVLFEPLMKAIEKVKKEGKARFVGVSTHSNEPEVIQAASDSKLFDIVLTAYNFKQKHQQEMNEAIAKAAKAGLGIVAMKVIAGAAPSKKALKEGKATVNASAALKWVLQNENVHTTIPGFTTFDQMETDISVMNDLGLNQEEKDYIKTAMSQDSLYCQGCQTCLPQCKHHLPIPELMRAYMYAYGYRNLSAARELLVSLDISSEACRHCDSCSVICASNFTVSEKIQDIVRLKDVPADFIV